ncbi:hypothetical protein BO82DRAFT_208027 [Aspergillus uvarum CBS 121591]|uniref:RING-type domain-containing protein n=1 Tax=Aspergillus uvarum CBS 121591 TaxID=1448315 RepID=A0A319BXP1_9EURO|nr:hypothetical protein BO82DRAFT_208027 [Aspergillus uvarum CBS 121591]PYH76329.1 hypothetical protein BO82DRAFT_208027 [Aspergillus uvarum CBS 121591]
MSNYFQGLSLSLLVLRPASIDIPPLSVTTNIKMASPFDTIIITDDEELPSLEPGSSQPRRASCRDYSYRKFENLVVEAVNETETTPSHKCKRTETKEPSALDNAFEELRKAVNHKIKQLQEKNRNLRDELHQERERHQKELFQVKEEHQKTQEELSQQREKRVLECNICYRQPDRWVVIQCGHMFCRSCFKALRTEGCPTCRKEMTGFMGCYPFAG